MGHALAVRSVNRLVIEINPFSNPLLLWAILGTILLQLMVVYIAPLRWRSLPFALASALAEGNRFLGLIL
jgi:magnesium-transporting ATPase (P-type)